MNPTSHLSQRSIPDLVHGGTLCFTLYHAIISRKGIILSI